MTTEERLQAVSDKVLIVSANVKWMMLLTGVAVASAGWMVKKSSDGLLEAGKIINQVQINTLQIKENKATISDLETFNELFRRHLQGDIEATIGLIDYPPPRKNPQEIICESYHTEGG